MKNIRYIIVGFFFMLCSTGAMAQTALSSYFLDGTLYNSKLNPAMKAERGYLSIGIGNLTLGTKGNVGISNFLYPRGDKLTTFMSGTVSQDEFLGKLPKAAKFGLDLDETVLAAGFRMFGGYFSLGVTVHSTVALSLPKGFFEFAKKGFQENSYSFSGIELSTMNYAAATIGYSHEIFDGFRIGVNAKYLAGLAHADILVDKLNVELNDEHWLVESHAQAQAALFCKANPTLDENDVINGIEFGDYTPTAMGFGFDLGFVYDMDDIVPGLTLSASVIDLGFINWKHMMNGHSTDTKVEFEGFDELDYNNMEATLESELESLGEDASKMIEFNYDGVNAVKTRLNTTVYGGVEYNMPFYTPLSVGVLYGQCFSPFKSNSWYDARGYLNISPLSWLEASVNYGYGTYGQSLGWMLNFHPKGINLFIGSDYMLTDVTPQFIPVNDLNLHFTVGLTLALGKRR